MSVKVTLIITALCLITLVSGNLPAQNFNRPAPPGMFSYEFVQTDSTFTGCYLLAPFKFGSNNNAPGHLHPYPMMLDQNGFVLWYSTTDSGSVTNFSYHPQHDLYTFIHSYNTTSADYVVLNSLMELQGSFQTINGVLPDAHEFTMLSNGNFILSGSKDSVMDLSAYTFNGVSGSATTNVRGFVVQEFDAQGQLVFEWNSNDYIFPTESYPAFYGYNANDFDYCHGNAIAEDDDGNLLLSFRHLNAVYKINHATGDIIWSLGGKSGDFTFTNDYKFSGQHDIQKLPNGNYSVFDNGNSHIPKRSRGVEYQLDTQAMTAVKVWEYLDTPPFFASAMGNHQTDLNRNHLINYGLVFRPRPTAQLVDDNGMLLAEIIMADSVQSYRARLAWPQHALPRPDISCSTSMGTAFLSAPSGLARYVWSTGDTTQSISISQQGVYQVWVPNGSGMVGSLPFYVNDISNLCSSSGIPETTIQQNMEVPEFFDLLGRKVQPATDGIYIIKYPCGKATLKYLNDHNY